MAPIKPKDALRPDPTWEAPDGFKFVAVPADDDWRLVTGKRCRYTVGPRKQSCKRPSVAELNRGRMNYGRNPKLPYLARTDCWWAYCADHLFGRWIEDGAVMHWIVQRIEVPS